MSFIKVLMAKLGKVFLAIAAVVRRAFCCIRRRRRNSDTPLPVTCDVRTTTMPVQQFPNNEGPDLHNWMTWEDELPSAVTVVENDDPMSKIESRNVAPTREQFNYSNFNRFNRQSSKEEEPEVDYFEGMVPSIRKPTKIIIKKREDNLPILSDGISKRLAVDTKISPVLTSELQHWVDEEGSWEGSMDLDNDIMNEADAVLRESKLLERDRRAMENLKKKQENEMLRQAKRDHLATKIS